MVCPTPAVLDHVPLPCAPSPQESEANGAERHRQTARGFPLAMTRTAFTSSGPILALGVQWWPAGRPSRWEIPSNSRRSWRRSAIKGVPPSSTRVVLAHTEDIGSASRRKEHGDEV